MADVGGIILKAAQGIVAQRQNQQRLAMQAQQLAMQMQQANHTIQLQREELDMRKSMMEQKEEALELEAKRAETGERAVAVQEGQLDIAKSRQELMGNLEVLLKKTEIDYTKAQIRKMDMQIKEGMTPSSIAQTLMAKNPAFIANFNKDIRKNAINAATQEFLSKGRVVIGDQTIERPAGMRGLPQETIYETIAINERRAIQARSELARAKQVMAKYEGQTGRLAKQAKASLDSATDTMDVLKSEREAFNQYAMAYQRLEAAGGDAQWKEVAAHNMAGANPAIAQLLMGLGVQQAKGITAPGGSVLYTPVQRLSYIGGAQGTKAGKFEEYTTDTGVTYPERLKFSWQLMRPSEKGTEAWNSGMAILKSLARDKFDTNESSTAFTDALRIEWGVDVTNPDEVSKFRAVVRDFLESRGFKPKR
jgi:hypothetical protein